MLPEIGSTETGVCEKYSSESNLMRIFLLKLLSKLKENEGINKLTLMCNRLLEDILEFWKRVRLTNLALI